MQPTTVNITMDKPNLNAMINEDRIEEEDKQAETTQSPLTKNQSSAVVSGIASLFDIKFM